MDDEAPDLPPEVKAGAGHNLGALFSKHEKHADEGNVSLQWVHPKKKKKQAEKAAAARAAADERKAAAEAQRHWCYHTQVCRRGFFVVHPAA